MTDERIANLPKWAQQHIAELQREPDRLREQVARANTECTVAKERARRLNDALDALMELLRCASRGGSNWATTVVATLDAYEIFQNPKSQIPRVP